MERARKARGAQADDAFKEALNAKILGGIGGMGGMGMGMGGPPRGMGHGTKAMYGAEGAVTGGAAAPRVGPGGADMMAELGKKVKK